MKLEGEIGEISVIEHLVEMGRERFTGAVRFENDGIIKIIYFKSGDVLSASTNDRADSVDEILLRAGKVTREHVKQALAKRKENETLGDAMLGLGFITRKELTWARRAQVIGVIRSIESWTVGQFTVVADYLPKREEGTLFPLAQIIIELIVTDQERQKYERALEGGDAVFVKAAGFDASFRALGLNEDAEAIAAEIDGSKSAADIASASGKDAFNVYKLLHALTVLGLLTRTDKVQVSPEISFGTEDDAAFAASAAADASDVWGDTAAPTLGTPTQSLGDTTSFGNSALPAFGEDEPALSLGLDFPSIPTAAQESSMLTPEADRSPVAPTPAWDAPPPRPAAPAPAAPVRAMTPAEKWDSPPYASPVLQPPKPAQEQWGFDEAQIETSRRATAPSPRATDRAPASMRTAAKKQASKPNRWVGMVIAAAVVILIAFGGFAGWNWWQSRSEASSQAQVTPAAQRAKRRTPPTTTAATQTTDTAAASATTTAPPPGTATTTVAAPPPVTASAAPAPTTSTQPAVAKPTPAVQPTPAPVLGRVTKTTPSAPPPMAPATVAAAPRVEHATTPTITNTAAPASAASRSQYDEMARQYAAQASGKYTVQFELVCEVASLKTAVAHGGSNIWFIPFAYKNRACYRVFWGHYETQEQANAAIAQVPAALRGSKPVVVSVPKP